ncbi:tetratricopeptide repeat protein [Bosea caraganae]|uniref:Tetratricopeptide repeat protein n=1 Tax=Bosea caraganae TaxID=2763117 RepID=A0A370KXV0_9HYPH|nr:tetratricopeptide repeat protein [Bosea caraganae]RDJ19825.1 tetratricopeptide repeat protein [Bosea caraganae]RDJ30034.1 tetratricopeptide repeat protein [Bosea caraganae]
MTAAKPALDTDSKRAALENLLAHPGFRVSQRNKNFLRFVVEESLAGRGDRIKAYTIAVDVFGRGADFDGMLDPVVRIEAGRLRQALTNYYAEHGQSERIHISLPRGGYEPTFVVIGDQDAAPHYRAEPTAPGGVEDPHRGAQTPQTWSDQPPEPAYPAPAPLPPQAPQRWWEVGLSAPAALARRVAGAISPRAARGTTRSPLVLAARVHALSADAPTVALSRTLSQSLPAAIARFEGLTVVAARPDQQDRDLIASTLSREPQSRRIYLVVASVKVDERGARALWQLTDGRTQSILWSGTTDAPFARNTSTSPEDEIAQMIARGIASSGAAISSFELRAIPSPLPPGYPCVTCARDYITNPTNEQRKQLVRCLEVTVAQSPEHAEAWAMLAYVQVDESRVNVGDPEASRAALARAEVAAARAEALAPYSAMTQQAISTVAFQNGNLGRFEAAGRRAIEINPSDPNLQVHFANRLFFLGRYDESMSMLHQVIDSRPTPMPTDSMAIIHHFYLRREYREALALAAKANMSRYYTYWIIVAAAHGQLGNRQAAEDALKRLLELRPNYGAIMQADFRIRRFREDTIEHVADGLRKAGLAIA